VRDYFAIHVVPADAQSAGQSASNWPERRVVRIIETNKAYMVHCFVSNPSNPAQIVVVSIWTEYLAPSVPFQT
jgi:hypothetical protein